MTDITPSELKMIYLQLFLMAIVGVFFFLYSSQPINQDVSVNANIHNTTTVSSSDASWITGLMAQDAGLGGLLPQGDLATFLLIVGVILIPMTIMNLVTAIRFIKDISTQWI
jgi:hypothetical protein